MKKLFFFKSASSNGNNSRVPPTSTDKQIYWEDPLDGGMMNKPSGGKATNSFRSPRGLFSKSRKQISDNQIANSVLRRSRSLSSAAFFDSRLGQGNFSCSGEQSKFPSSITGAPSHHQCDHSSRHRALEKQSKQKRIGAVALQNAHGLERPGSSQTHPDSSGSSSVSSSNVSSKVLDRYIDGEQEQERSRLKNSSSQRFYTGNGNGGGRLPPRVQYTAPASPTYGIKDKPMSHSFREPKGVHTYFPSKDWVESGFGHESPRRLAKNVIERLSQSYVCPKTSSKELDHDIPITIEDIYGGSLNRGFDSIPDVVAPKSYSLDEPYEIVDNGHREDYSGFQKQNYFPRDNYERLKAVETEVDIDVELQRRFKEAEERVMHFSEELEQELFIRDCGFDAPALIQTVSNLTEERVSLAHEISDLLHTQISERVSVKEKIRLVTAELESRNQMLEKEKNEIQSGLEKELDRRSSEWSLKLENYRSEEQRLRDRVRELAEQNVSLQRELSSFSERETGNKLIITHFEQQLKEVATKMEEISEENRDLRQNLSELQESYRAAEQDRGCIQRNFEEKEKECKELHKSITRLVRTCNEQEKTIDGLRDGFSEEIGKTQSEEKFVKHVSKLQMEQMRLIGVELALRREVESFRIEVDSLRHENIILLNRLKGNGKESGALTFKLDKEMRARIYCLQNQGLSLINESSNLCSKLLEFIKGKTNQLSETKNGTEITKNGLDGQFLVESDIKVVGFRRGIESLSRSLQTISVLLHEKSSSGASPSLNSNESGQLNDQTSEDIIKYELKAETLLTSLLREKYCSKELEVEQLQAELATAVRGNDILRSEAQNSLDQISCDSHRLKDLELQMLKKDEIINRLQSDLQKSTKELSIIKGILPNVSEERDLMWEEVKQYNEKNMLLYSEVNMLKKKIETLDEDILLKEGQITILKDALGNKPFDLLASLDSPQEFLLE